MLIHTHSALTIADGVSGEAPIDPQESITNGSAGINEELEKLQTRGLAEGRMVAALTTANSSDCFNLVQAEALLCGKPTLSSDIPALRHLVRESGFGVLCKPEDPQAIVDGFRTLMQRREELRARHSIVLSLLDLTTCKENTKRFLLGDNLE